MNSIFCNYQRLAPMAIILVASLIIMPNFGKAADVHFVNEGESIRSAILNACSNDTIMINPGVYTEFEIIIQKPLTLIGKDYPVIDAQGQGDIFLIAAKDVTIQGLELRNTGTSNIKDPAAIKVFDSRNLRFENNRLIETFFGIHISNSREIYATGNYIYTTESMPQRTANGIHLWKCSHSMIESNLIRGHRDGIYLEFVTDTESNYNIVEYNNRYGLHFMFSHDNAYYHNEFRHNGAGVAVMYTKNVTMMYNLFEQNLGTGAYGILLKDINDSEMKYNRFINNTIGIYMEGSNRNIIAKNEFRSNGWAIKILASNIDNKLQENNFIGNTFDISTNSRQVNNTLSMNYWDKYEGYDLGRDGFGDVPHHPINLYSTIVERMPHAIILWRSFVVGLLDRAERVMPVITPENMKDEQPKIRPHDINFKP